MAQHWSTQVEGHQLLSDTIVSTSVNGHQLLQDYHRLMNTEGDLCKAATRRVQLDANIVEQ